MTDKASAADEPNTDDLGHQLRASLQRSPFATVTPGQEPTARDVWAALGGRRGVIESVLPGIGFLVVYTATQSLLWSVSAPIALSLALIVARLIQRSPIQPAVVGLAGVVASAAVAVLSGRPENNFVLGLWVNAVYFAAVLISLLARRPLVGLVVGVLLGDKNWRDDRAKFVMASWATVIWAIMFGLRLLVQVPLYLAGEEAVGTLATAKLAMGIPLYGLTLWLTWLLVGSAYRGGREQPVGRI